VRRGGRRNDPNNVRTKKKRQKERERQREREREHLLMVFGSQRGGNGK
jgi:hypothetical protein